MNIFVSCRNIAACNCLIGQLRRRTCNVYNSDKSSCYRSPQRGNLLIENDIFLNPEEVDHNQIIRGVYRKVATKYKETAE
jgi:hypothetical protein